MPRLFAWSIVPHAGISAEYIPYDNSAINSPGQKSWRFEYNPMLDICANLPQRCDTEDYIGIFSWKLGIKTGLTKAQLYEKFKAASARHPDAAVFNLSPYLGENIGNCGCFMDWSAKGHGEELRLLVETCCSHTGLQYCNNPRHVIYANQFIARRDIYLQYMSTIIEPCLQLLEGPLWPRVNKNAHYTAGVALRQLKERTGLAYYNYLPFVLERMAMQFIHHYNYTTIALI